MKSLGNLRPEHFKNPIDYRVVPKFLEDHKKKLNFHRQEKFKLKKKISNLKELLSDLRSKGLISENAAEDLKVSNNLVSNI